VRPFRVLVRHYRADTLYSPYFMPEPPYLQPKSSCFLSWWLAPIQSLTPNTCIHLSHQATTRFRHGSYAQLRPKIHSLRILAACRCQDLNCDASSSYWKLERSVVVSSISTRHTNDQATRHGFYNGFDAPLGFNHRLKLLGTATGAN
jgi:hypothetical protein